jgi:hypothetical protein
MIRQPPESLESPRNGISHEYLKPIWGINRSRLKVLGSDDVHIPNLPALKTGHQAFEGKQ